MVTDIQTAPRRWSVRGHDPRRYPVSADEPIDLTTRLADCGKKGHARKGCHCVRCEGVRARELAYQSRWRAEKAEHVTDMRRRYRVRTNNASTKKYEKTPKGYLMRSYRNMKSRVTGIQKTGSWTGKELLPKEDFYVWALSDPTFKRLFAAYEESGYERKLAPSPDRIDSSKGYTLDNMRWLTHSENSRLGSKSPRRKKAA